MWRFAGWEGVTGVTVGGCVLSVLEDTDKVIETYLLILVI